MEPVFRAAIAVALVLTTQPSWANETMAVSCEPSNYMDFIRCAEKSSSEIQISEQQVKSAAKLEDAAGQWINPDLEADTVAKGSQKSETTAALLFTLRLGGKRSALINEAKSEIQRAQADRDLSVQQARLALMISAYRLTHIQSLLHLQEESVATFSKIVNQFQKRAALSPEQDVSLSIFRMALSDHQLKLTNLKSEQEKILQSLVASTGVSKKAILKSLPSRKENWPELSGTSEVEISPQVRMALAELKLAQSQKERADGEAWPDLKIGPSVRSTKDNGENTTYYGLGLSMPIPAFTLNGGNRAYRAQRVTEAELVLQQSKRRLLAARNELVNRYNQTVQSLKSGLSPKSLTEKHELVERQFFKGLVSSPLVIEAHRQLFDLEERRNASEIEALEAFGNILILDNKFTEVIL